MRNIRRQFAAELRKYYLEVKFYYPNHIVNLVVLFIMFSGFFKLFTNSDVIPDSAYYIGFVYWFYANGIIGESSVSISTEKQSGTFEQLLIKPSSLSSILFYRSACWLLFQSAEIAVVMLALHMILSVPMSFSLLIIPVFIITMLGLIGISYLLSALTLVFTKTASFTTIFSYLLLFFSGVAEGVGERGAAYYLLPLSQGIDISRRIILKLDVTVLDIGLLVFNTIVYLLLGIVVFHSIMKSGRKKGISMEY